MLNIFRTTELYRPQAGESVLVWVNVSHGKTKTAKQKNSFNSFLVGEMVILKISNDSIQFEPEKGINTYLLNNPFLTNNLVDGKWVRRDEVYLEKNYITN